MKQLPALLILLLPLQALPARAQEDAFSDLLTGRGYDREKIIQQFEHLNRVTVSPPPAEEETPGAESASAPAAAPAFRPPSFQPPPGAEKPPDRLTLLLPQNAAGSRAAAADAFLQGCTDGLEIAGSFIQINTYAHDGSREQALRAYQNAVTDGARFIIGPLLRNNVRALRQAYPAAPVRTLLLQPTAQPLPPGANFHILTIDTGAEAGELARLISGTESRVMVVADNSPLSQRQKTAFLQAWPPPPPPEIFYVYDSDSDWQKLFDRLREQAEREEEKAQTDAGGDKPRPFAVFAAGSGDFIRRARNFVPQGYPVYASSIFFSGQDDEQFLNNLRVLEMPWFAAAGSDAVRRFADPLVRTLPPLQQRFYALGADACRAAQQAAGWHDGWTLDGASGALLYKNGVFRRRGMPAQYESGYLKPLAQ